MSYVTLLIKIFGSYTRCIGVICILFNNNYTNLYIFLTFPRSLNNITIIHRKKKINKNQRNIFKRQNTFTTEKKNSMKKN